RLIVNIRFNADDEGSPVGHILPGDRIQRPDLQVVSVVDGLVPLEGTGRGGGTGPVRPDDSEPSSREIEESRTGVRGSVVMDSAPQVHRRVSGGRSNVR